MRKWITAALAALLLCLGGCGGTPVPPEVREAAETAETEKPQKTPAPEQPDAPEATEAPAPDTPEPTAEPEGVRELSQEEFDRLLEERYGVSSGQDWSTGTQEAFYTSLDGARTVEFTPPQAYPEEVRVTVTAPDLEAMLRGMDAADYPDAQALRAEVLRRLEAGEYELRRSELTVTLPEADYDFSQTEDFALLDALYGGLLSFYRETLVADWMPLFGGEEAAG